MTPCFYITTMTSMIQQSVSHEEDNATATCYFTVSMPHNLRTAMIVIISIWMPASLAGNIIVIGKYHIKVFFMFSPSMTCY